MAAAGHDPGIYRDVMVVLTTAAVIVPLVQRLKVSPILGFLLAGIALGPKGLGALPAFDWVTISDEKSLSALAELGVVFLMFLIGLELSLKRLTTMRRQVFGLGGLQIALSGAAIGLAAWLLGNDPEAATLIGFSLALSSTAIVVEVLSRQNRFRTATGRTSFAVLLAQDLAVVPLLMLVTILGPGQQDSIVTGLLLAFAQAALAIAAIVIVGSVLLRPLFRLVASSDNTELFVAATLFVAVGSGLLTAVAGLSMALGAFIAGLLLAETEFRRAIEATIDPFKGLLLGVFFFTVGMTLDIGKLLTDPLPVIGATVALIALKVAIAYGLLVAFGAPRHVALQGSMLLGPGGEFAFIVLGLAITEGIVNAESGALILAVTSLSMALIPLLDYVARRLTPSLTRQLAADPALADLPGDANVRAIVIGYGRVGSLVSEMLDRHNVKHLVIERAPEIVSRARKQGRPVYFGDAKNVGFLNRCGFQDAAAVIITIHVNSEIDDIVRVVRAERENVAIVSRSRDAEHARHLYDLGVTDVVPETIEASLQLTEAALVGLGVPTGLVIASVHERRDEFRDELQAAAKRAGRDTTRGLRAKTAKKPAVSPAVPPLPPTAPQAPADQLAKAEAGPAKPR
jgi:CPA2 family monovalent cation:H+ antiporter-2